MAKLALLGGEKSVGINYKDTASMPLVSEKAISAVVELMRKGEISISPTVYEFEKKFCEYIGVKYGLCGPNGTTALQEAIFAVGAKPGDEIIVPSYTFWATVTPIVASNCVPVFCEVDKDTHNIDPEDIKRKITSKTKAIMVVHVWGNPADMDPIMAIAKENNLAVIEDCSHAHGATYKGKKVGSIGDVAAFSLQGSKLMVAGEGGILVTNSKECYERAAALGHYERLEKFPEESYYKKYMLTGMGYKHRTNPLGIAIANCDLDELDARNEIRNTNGKYLDKCISDIDCIKVQKVVDGAERQYSYHFANYDSTRLQGVSLLTFMKALKSEGIMCGSCGYGRLHKAPLFVEGDPYGNGCPCDCGHAVKGAYDRKNVSLPVTEFLAVNSFMLAPRFEKPCKELIDQYSAAYHKVVANVDELLQYEKENPVSNEQPKVSSRSINML